MPPLSDTDLDAAAAALRNVSAAFAEEIGRPPTSRELGEILVWPVRSLPDDTFADVHPSSIVALRPEPAPGSPRSDAPSATDRLNDNAFVLAGEVVRRIATALRAGGEEPAVQVFCDALVQAVHRAGAGLLSDPEPAVAGIVPETRPGSRIVTRPGDVVAIPARDGRYFLAVVITKDPLGTAYGLFEGTHPLRPITRESAPPADPRPVYSDDEEVATGRWRVVGRDERLLSLFPDEPEVFAHLLPGQEAAPGAVGIARTAGGRTRPVEPAEAEEIGLLSGEYQQSWFPDELEERLNRRLPPSTGGGS